MPRTATVALATLFAALVFCPSALADADPASDILLGEPVFYPYSPPVSGRLQTTLNAEATAEARAHFPIKVALIDGPTDLGAVPVFFGKPQQYADFLDQELSLFGTRHPPLLVVMPDGYGTKGLPAAATAVAVSLAKPVGKQSNDLARAAIAAVPKLASAAGHPFTRTSGASGAGANGPGALAIAGVAIAAVALAAAIFGTRRRLSRSR